MTPVAASVLKQVEKGYQLSPYFEDVLKRIRNSGRSESFTVIRIGNILHCVFPDA